MTKAENLLRSAEDSNRHLSEEIQQLREQLSAAQATIAKERIGTCHLCDLPFTNLIEHYQAAHPKPLAAARKPLVYALKLSGEALQCADYAITHPESDQRFALTALRDAMSRADDALAKVQRHADKLYAVLHCFSND
jgi:hypothetical protein